MLANFLITIDFEIKNKKLIFFVKNIKKKQIQKEKLLTEAFNFNQGVRLSCIPKKVWKMQAPVWR